MAEVVLDYNKLMAQTTVTVNLKGFNRVWKVRTFLAILLFNLGARVLGTGLEIEGGLEIPIDIQCHYHTPKPPAPKPGRYV